MEIVNTLIVNWYIVVAILVVLVAAIFICVKFLGLPTKTQVGKIKKLLLYWVTKAEEELGGGTGKYKLRFAYDLFTGRFPLVAKLISFETFSLWVDEALDEVKADLDANAKLKAYVDNSTSTTVSE